jgi:hypothetical protein
MNKDLDSGYLRDSALMVAGAIGLYMIHFIALDHFRVAPGDEDLKAIIAYLPREASIALFIAAVLNVFVEKNTQRRHALLEANVQDRLSNNAESLNADIRKNLLRSVFAQNLGEHVIEQIEKKLFEPAPYRLEADVIYSIAKIDAAEGKPAFVTIACDMRYVSTNPSRHKVSPSVGIHVTSPDEFADYVSLVSIHCDGEVLVEPESWAGTKKGGTIDYKKENAYDLEFKQERTIEIRSMRADYLQSSESFVSAVPVEILRVTVQHPSDLRVDSMSLHPDELECIGDGSTTKVWRLKGLVPGQGISFWWRPVSQKPAVV